MYNIFAYYAALTGGIDAIGLNPFTQFITDAGLVSKKLPRSYFDALFYAVNKLKASVVDSKTRGGGKKGKSKKFSLSLPTILPGGGGEEAGSMEVRRQRDREATAALNAAAYDAATTALTAEEDKFGSSKGISRIEFIVSILRRSPFLTQSTAFPTHSSLSEHASELQLSSRNRVRYTGIAIDRYIRTKELNDVSDACDRLMSTITMRLGPVLPPADHFRRCHAYTGGVDATLRKYALPLSRLLASHVRRSAALRFCVY